MRVKRGTVSRRRHKKVLKMTKGQWGTRSKLFRRANESMMKSQWYAYRDRRVRRRDLRRLWIARINAASRQNGMSYSKFMHGLKLANVPLDRKVLADIAVRDAAAFTEIASIAQGALEKGGSVAPAKKSVMPKADPAKAEARAKAKAEAKVKADADKKAKAEAKAKADAAKAEAAAADKVAKAEAKAKADAEKAEKKAQAAAAAAVAASAVVADAEAETEVVLSETVVTETETKKVEEASVTIIGDDPATADVEVSETINVKVTEEVIEGDASIADVDSAMASATSITETVTHDSSTLILGDDPSTAEVELSETTNVTVTERVIDGDSVEVSEYSDSVEDLIAKYASADAGDDASAEDLIAKYATSETVVTTSSTSKTSSKSGGKAKTTKTSTSSKAKTSKSSKKASGKGDDLKKIEGIGPKIAELLNNQGITTFAQLAETDASVVKGHLADAGSRYNRHDPTTWPQQAGLAAAGKWDELEKLQDELDGGRPA